ncbi:restriction endonuclease subunit S [Aliarcobacter skirrowii]|uniref:restriction endonuclease subunit S n=1 Tax=Aliarcobacter skirrowii TaxID=28200 RepID=UPI003207F96C
MSELYSLPKGWEWKKLGELCDFIRGPFGGSLKKQIFKENGNAVYEQSHAIYNQFEQIRYFIDDEKFEKMKRFELRPNSLIMSCSGTIGKVAIVPNNVKKGIINQALLMLTPNNELNNIFLKLMMESNFFQTLLSDNSTGAAIANVASVKVLKDLDIPLPPLEEQKRIVAKLDNLFAKIDKAIALHQKNIDEADIFMASVLNDVFAELEEKYPLKKVSDGLKNILTGTTPPTKEEKYYNEPSINWYSPSDFGKSKVLSISKNMINSIALTDKKAKIYEKNTLLLVAIGATVGKIGVIKEEASSNQQITAMKFKDDIDVDFSYYWFYYIKQIIINTASAATLPIINQSAIKDLKFIIPPLPTQQKVVSYLDEISQKMEKIKNLQKKKMQSLKELKASILDKAFKGEL